LGDNRAPQPPPFTFQPWQTAEDFASACWWCNCILRRDKPLKEFVAEQGIAYTVPPVVKAYLNREPKE
jgi:hypothetical protein